MHPIDYSFRLNLLILLTCAALAWLMNQPLLLPLGFMVMQHMVARFSKDDDDDPGPPGAPFGFVPSDEDGS
jgi:hypothetical protein